MGEHRAFRGISAEQIEIALQNIREQLASTRRKLDELKRLEGELTCAEREALTALKLARFSTGNVFPKLKVRLGAGKEILTASALMRELGVSRPTLHAMVADGRLPEPTRIGRKALGFRRSEIHRWVAAYETRQEGS